MDEAYFAPTLLFAGNASFSGWADDYNLQTSYAGAALPVNVALLTLRVWNGTSGRVDVAVAVACGVTRASLVLVVFCRDQRPASTWPPVCSGRRPGVVAAGERVCVCSVVALQGRFGRWCCGGFLAELTSVGVVARRPHSVI